MDGRPSGSIFPLSPFSKRVRKPKTYQEQPLSHLDIQGPFDFVLGIGCFHGLPARSRQAYVQEVARVTRPGGLFMIWAIASDRWPFLPGAPSTQDKEIAERFGQDFTLERVQKGEGRWMANWYTLRRR